LRRCDDRPPPNRADAELPPSGSSGTTQPIAGRPIAERGRLLRLAKLGAAKLCIALVKARQTRSEDWPLGGKVACRMKEPTDTDIGLTQIKESTEGNN
jgi:hypothetical protein